MAKWWRKVPLIVGPERIEAGALVDTFGISPEGREREIVIRSAELEFCIAAYEAALESDFAIVAPIKARIDALHSDIAWARLALSKLPSDAQA